MALILGIETSSKNCSVALFENGKVLASKENDEGFSHSENLHLFIQEVLKESGKEMNQLQGILVGAGPGSFTGLRIGVATAKGLCYTLDIPLMSMSSLLNMTIEAASKAEGKVKMDFRPLIDARRMEVYTARYSDELKEKKEASAIVVDEETFAKELEKPICFFGDGMPKVRELYSQNQNALFLEGILPSALNMGDYAEMKFDERDFEDTAYYEPFYLKGFHFTKPKKQF